MSAPHPPSPHRARQMAESFGSDAERYDRARPAYPDELIERIVTGAPGRDILDVGCGTGIAGRQFRAAGCTVLGVEPDTRMAQFARGSGLAVEVATFEAWEPRGRTFDAVVAGQSWHWIDPDAGAEKAARVLRPAGLLALFGHVLEPPQPVADALAAACRQVIPDWPFANQPARRPLEAYGVMYANFAAQIVETGSFAQPEHWRIDRERRCTREQWLDLLPTTGGLTRVAAPQLAEVLGAVGGAIDDMGGAFSMTLTTLATVAVRSAR